LEPLNRAKTDMLQGISVELFCRIDAAFISNILNRKDKKDFTALTSTPFPVSPKGEKLWPLLPPWGKAGKGVA
jgi:hypothetical protein